LLDAIQQCAVEARRCILDPMLANPKADGLMLRTIHFDALIGPPTWSS
jgi:hypothetical protein